MGALRSEYQSQNDGKTTECRGEERGAPAPASFPSKTESTAVKSAAADTAPALPLARQERNAEAWAVT